MTSRQLPAERLTQFLGCPCTGFAELRAVASGWICTRCARRINVSDTGIFELVDPLQLDADGRRELREHSDRWAPGQLEKFIAADAADFRRSYYSRDRLRSFRLLAPWLRPHAAEWLCFLGAGTGRELEYLLEFMQLRGVVCSDLAAERLSVVPFRLSDRGVEYGLFTTDLNHITLRDLDVPLVIINALHHTGDMHEALRRILERGHKRVFLIEPADNRLIRALEIFGLAVRVEYSGVKPGRLERTRLRQLARSCGYRLDVKTFWSFPPDYFERLAGSYSEKLAGPFLALMDALSWLTSPLYLGNGAVVRLSK